MATKGKNKNIKRYFLYVTGFFCGMSIMAIELGASRLMAPYYSSSQIIYTIIIGTVMIAMAFGSILGGKMADKYEAPDKLFMWIFIAACWTCLIPLVGKYIIAGVALVLAASPLANNFLVIAAFLSCIIVFVPPLLVMGMVTPNLIKYAVGNLENNGRVVGTIEALNTIGSIIGTFIPTFVTIPFIGTSWTFLIYSFILFGICLFYFFKKHQKRLLYSFICLIVIAAGILGSSFGNIAFFASNTVYEGESIYNYLRVEKNSEQTILSTNVLFGVQSLKNNKDGLTGMYYDYALAANLMADKGNDGILDILILGLGTGTYAYQSNLYVGDCVFDGVEIDQKIVDLAYEYFDLPSNVNVFVQDGRIYLDNCDKKYDVILVDAYQDITIPFHMSSIEFFSKVKDHLNPKGVMVVNMNMYTSNEGGINDYLSGTISHVFNNIYGANCYSNSNYELFACNDFDLKDKLSKTIENKEITNHQLLTMMKEVERKLEKVTNKEQYVLTDNIAPVEILGMNVLDDMIFEEINYYKSKIKGLSLKEIVEMLSRGELF